MCNVARSIAGSIAGSAGDVTELDTGRDDLVTFKVTHGTNPAEITAKRQTTPDKWAYEWNRIHVAVPGNHLSMNWLQDVQDRFGMTVTDVWSLVKDRERDGRMDFHKDYATVRIALEARD